MTALEILMKLIKESEGCSLTAYRCPAHVLTIGFGQTKGVTEGMVWTQQQADDDLLVTAMDVIAQALKASPVLVNATMQRQAAIADFLYNLGIGNYNKSTLKLRVGQSNWISAATEIKKWNKAGGVVLKGLTIRRKKEAELLLA
jgi:lysozyme